MATNREILWLIFRRDNMEKPLKVLSYCKKNCLKRTTIKKIFRKSAFQVFQDAVQGDE